MLRDNKLPPQCGEDVDVPLLFNPYQQGFQDARRKRFCLNCATVGSMTSSCVFICAKCGTRHESNLTAPRLFDRFLILAGRGGGKTLIGAHAAREEMMVPNSIGWVMGPTYKILHDSTLPTLVRLIPKHWIKRWDPEHMEIRLVNNALVAFRSLEDPERARGPHGVGWGWFDEAAQAPERAYDVFEPTLIKAGGIAICTTTVLGYDWTYDKIEKRALVYNEPGYWATRYWTEENPLFASSPVMQRQIARAKRSMTPEFYAQEYKAERKNATGLIYDYQALEKATLHTPEDIQKFIPEWPHIEPTRKVLIGLDSGADHPFGALLIVVTERGLVVVREYLKRQQAISQHLESLRMAFVPSSFANVTWAANKNEANLRLEFAVKGVGVVQAENKHEVGIQRVQSWLLQNQLFFYAPTCPLTLEQMQAYRYAPNIATDGQKKKEGVFKLKDELPDALRYAVMAYPTLPEVPESSTARSLERYDERTKFEIEQMRRMMNPAQNRDLAPVKDGYPIGDFWDNREDTDEEFMLAEGGW